MMKFFVYVLSSVLMLLSGVSFVFGQGRDAVGTDPKDVLDHIIDPSDDTIKTNIDDVDRTTGAFAEQNRLANTLDSLRVESVPYLQRLTFFLLTLGVGLIVYNGMRLVFSPLQPDEVANVKKRMVYIFLGLLIGTGFYYLIKIVLSVVQQVSN